MHNCDEPGSDSLWVVCEHIVEGTAEEALLRPDKIAVCKVCTVMPPEGIEYLRSACEECMKGYLEKIGTVVGMKYLDKTKID